MPRPRLTEDSFLLNLFSPSKNPLPAGIRKTSRKGTKGQRKARVNSWNKMPGRNQEILRRSGLVESFLKGEVTVTEAKRRLRGKAVSKGLVKPLKQRAPARKVSDEIYTVYRHVDKLLTTERKNQDHLRDNAVQMSPQQRAAVLKIKDEMEYRREANSESQRWITSFDDGIERSVLWYH